MTQLGLFLFDDDGEAVIPPSPITFGPWTPNPEASMSISGGKVSIASLDGNNPRVSRQILGLIAGRTYEVSATLFFNGEPRTRYFRGSNEPLLNSIYYGQKTTTIEETLTFSIAASNQPVYVGLIVDVNAIGLGGAISQTLTVVEMP